ncbi:MAG: BRO family protein [Candidatus Shapirobacteria bacterium]|nr:BRO family protein [Candidatus Shapirobacteria bacterium]
MDNSDNLIIKKFEDLDITVYGTFDNPLFKANDIGDLLGIKNIRDTIKDYNGKQKGVVLTDTLGGLQETTMLTEQGLYKVLMKSRKPIAEKFQDWVCQVIEEIRKTGKYEVQKNIENVTKSNMLIEQFSNKSINYIGMVKEINADESIVKYGETDHIDDSLKRHQTMYGNQFYYIHATECDRPKYLERQIQIHNDTVSRHVKEYDGIKKKELIRLDKNFTKTDLINLMESIKQSMKIQGSIVLELEREKTKQIEMETSLDKIKEATKQKEEDTKQSNNEVEKLRLQLEIMKYSKTTTANETTETNTEIIATETIAETTNQTTKISRPPVKRRQVEKQIPTCTICSKTFRDNSVLKNHMITHSTDRPFKCLFENCIKDFKTKNDLKAHERIHSGIRPYKCDTIGCKWDFFTLSHLNRHKITHI